MNKILFSLLLIISSFTVISQSTQKDSVVSQTSLTIENLYSYQNKGWAMMEFHGKKFLLNFSNKEYVLFFRITCKQEGKKPNFLIEYSDNYRDGDYGGMDFTSSSEERFQKIIVLIDDKEVTYPFETSDKNILSEFISDLKKAKILTFKFYDMEFNPDLGKEELNLNRELSFELENSELLDQAVDCK